MMLLLVFLVCSFSKKAEDDNRSKLLLLPSPCKNWGVFSGTLRLLFKLSDGETRRLCVFFFFFNMLCCFVYRSRSNNVGCPIAIARNRKVSNGRFSNWASRGMESNLIGRRFTKEIAGMIGPLLEAEGFHPPVFICGVSIYTSLSAKADRKRDGGVYKVLLWC